MKEDILAEHLESIRLSAARSRTLTTWILVFAITLGVTVLSEAAGTKRLEQERRALASIAPEASWSKLRNFYQRTDDLVEPYAREDVTPWSRLCFFLQGESETNSLDEICTELHDYSYALRNIAHYQNLGTPFTALPKEALQNLNTVVHHEPTSETFIQGLEALKQSALSIQSSTSQSSTSQSSSSQSSSSQSSSSQFSSTVKALLEHGASKEFTHLLDHFLLQDLQNDETSESQTVHRQRLAARIKALPLDSLAQVSTRAQELDNQLAALKASSSVALPLIGLRVPHRIFWIAGVAVNSVLLLTLLFSYLSAQRSFREHMQLSGGEGEDLYKVLMERFAIRADQGLLVHGWIAALLFLPTVGSIVEVMRRGEGFSLRAAVVGGLALANVVILVKIFTTIFTIARGLSHDETEV